jgi:2-dehydro-3-deoxyphosphooctonate aldolase (KDO 8-P synthase)
MRIIAGPCQHESLEHSLKIANECKRVCDEHNIEYIFKASYDKANRTSFSGKRGRGLVPTMTEFLEMKKEIPGLKILTDIHTVEDLRAIINTFKKAIDVVQIPAFLCRQTDLIWEACGSGYIVNIKKGQFLAPWDVQGILSKTIKAENEVWITERGTSFGYNTLVVDFTGLQYMMEEYNVPIVLDATHAVQKPGGQGSSSGGNREYVPGLLRAGAALGIQNFFMEVHDNPDLAPSDGPNMLPLYKFEKVVKQIKECAWNG